MTKFAIGFGRMFLIGVVAALVVVSAPVATVYAMRPGGSSVPYATAQAPNERLELAWGREQMIHDRLGFMFDHADQRIALVQQLIDKAQAKGKDVTAVQAALDALNAAVKTSRPSFEGMQRTFVSHPGFDASGKVIDAIKAAQTVRDLDVQLRGVHSSLAGPMQSLRDAIAAARQTNQSLVAPSPTPSQ